MVPSNIALIYLAICEVIALILVLPFKTLNLYSVYLSFFGTYIPIILLVLLVTFFYIYVNSKNLREDVYDLSINLIFNLIFYLSIIILFNSIFSMFLIYTANFFIKLVVYIFIGLLLYFFLIILFYLIYLLNNKNTPEVKEKVIPTHEVKKEPEIIIEENDN